jgi:hypothetical protein
LPFSSAVVVFSFLISALEPSSFACLSVLNVQALNRWVEGDRIIKKKKEHESDEAFEERVNKMTHVIHNKVLLWFVHSS